MNFPLTRHLQRYEYVLQKGYVRGRSVTDVGCGCGYGSVMLSSEVASIFAVDPQVSSSLKGVVMFTAAKLDRIIPIPEDIFDFRLSVDVCVAMEVFEHMVDPTAFINKLSTLCKFAFITTPLNGMTGKTRNPEHIVEYSAEDFDKIVNEGFEILDKVYQHGDMSITKEAKPDGCSYDLRHVVQMVWCRSRNG